MAVSLICWALWLYGCQSDMLGFGGHVAVSLICWALVAMCMAVSLIYVGLCGCTAVSLICWALWPCGCQSDMLGFVAIWLSV